MTQISLQFLDVSEQSNVFGKWLRQKRKEKFLSMEELGKRAGMAKQYISVLERGEPHALTGKPVTPTVEKVEALAKALDADINEARAAAGYASGDSQIPEPVAKAFARSGHLNENDMELIANFVDMLENQRKSEIN
jgi:transcriptional regulator with XRE-family HTH domain